MDSDHSSGICQAKVYNVSNFFSNRLILIKEHCNWSCSRSLFLQLPLTLVWSTLISNLRDVNARARACVCLCVSWQKIKTCFHLTQNKAISIFRLCGHYMPDWLVTTGTDDADAAAVGCCLSGLFGFICFSFVNLMFRLLHSWNEMNKTKIINLKNNQISLSFSFQLRILLSGWIPH